MSSRTNQRAAAWRPTDLEQDRSWVLALSDVQRAAMTRVVQSVFRPGKPLFDYRRDDFDFGPVWPVLKQALDEVAHGRGIALVRGLPREGMSEQEFELLTWAIGLHAGVARPQSKASQYLSAVRDAGVAYRTGTGRGYSSSAELDFHTDSADVVFLTCYNRAVSGGMSIVTSSHAGRDVMAEEYPQLVDWLDEPLAFSRQGEEAPDEGPYTVMPVFDEMDGKLYGRWNWNRVNSAKSIPGAPQIDPRHQEALDRFDEIVRRPDVAYSMWLQPGDLQIINSFTTLHSRTEFVDDAEPSRKRLLFRLWIAPPGSDRLPDSWRALYRSTDANAVRGGIRGVGYGENCREFEVRQAADHGMVAT